MGREPIFELKFALLYFGQAGENDGHTLLHVIASTLGGFAAALAFGQPIRIFLGDAEFTISCWPKIAGTGYRLNGQRLAAEGFASSDELSVGIASALERYELSQLAVAETSAVLTLANNVFAEAVSREKLFVEVEAADAALEQLEGKVPEFDAVRARKSRAELARRMADLDSSLTDARTRHGSAVAAQASASEAEVRARDAAAAASALLADLRSLEHEIEALGRKVDEMDRHHQVLVDSAERRWPFQCTALADGSREVEPGTPVSFVVARRHGGTFEADRIAPLPSPRRPREAPEATD